MIPLAQRQTLLGLIQAACTSGARLAQACKIVGLSTRSVQRWLHPDGADGDQRESGKRKAVEPANKLSAQECADVMATLNSEEFKDLPPSQVVPRLSDQGRYLASESTMYRLLKNAHQLGHRRLQAVPQKRSKPRALVASQPDQVYCWDITYLPSQVRGQHFYLYLFEDLFSRKIVGWQVFDCESAELASQLLRDICERQGISKNQLTVHSDNGSPMKGQTMLAALQGLGVAHTRSRPAGQQRQPLRRVHLQDLEVPPRAAAARLCRPAQRKTLGHRTCGLVQQPASPQRHRLCDTQPASRGPR
ncbi:MAG: DDE-type integrase/transposase/recombinase [Ideonella sp.]|nr:DDE-type integrase/transposase/recombinase [Ideonella sp.]